MGDAASSPHANQSTLPCLLLSCRRGTVCLLSGASVGTSLRVREGLPKPGLWPRVCGHPHTSPPHPRAGPSSLCCDASSSCLLGNKEEKDNKDHKKPQEN